MLILHIIGLSIVGVIWGITNPWLEKGSEGQKSDDLDLSMKSLIKLILNYKFLVPFGLNQLGSVLYYILLGNTNFSVAPMIANSISFVVTFVVENRLKQKPFVMKDLLGMSLVVVGVCLCLI
jgi:drug/metabolite transporter (DMT)-like permease